MDLKQRRANMENMFAQIEEKIATVRNQLAELEALRQQQIGALQLADVLLQEAEETEPEEAEL